MFHFLTCASYAHGNLGGKGGVGGAVSSLDAEWTENMSEFLPDERSDIILSVFDRLKFTEWNISICEKQSTLLL